MELKPGFIFPVTGQLKLTSLTFRLFNTISELVSIQLLIHLLRKYLSTNQTLYSVYIGATDELQEFRS